MRASLLASLDVLCMCVVRYLRLHLRPRLHACMCARVAIFECRLLAAGLLVPCAMSVTVALLYDKNGVVIRREAGGALTRVLLLANLIYC